MLVFWGAWVAVLAMRKNGLRGRLSSAVGRTRGGEESSWGLIEQEKEVLAQDDEDMYVTLQFDPLRVLMVATRRIRWALGMAWRTLSRAVRRKPTPKGLEAALRASRRRGVAVLVVAAKRDPARVAALVADSDAWVSWTCDWETAARLATKGVGSAPRGQALVALALAKRHGLRVLAVKHVSDSDDAETITRWFERARLAHDDDLDELRRVAEDAALVRAQADEFAAAVDSDDAQRRDDERRAADAALEAERRRLQEETDRLAVERRAAKAASLPPEPTTGDTCVVAVRDLTGAKHTRKFPADVTSRVLFDWLDVLGLDGVDIKKAGDTALLSAEEPFDVRPTLGRRVLLECVVKRNPDDDDDGTPPS